MPGHKVPICTNCTPRQGRIFPAPFVPPFFPVKVVLCQVHRGSGSSRRVRISNACVTGVFPYPDIYGCAQTLRRDTYRGRIRSTLCPPPLGCIWCTLPQFALLQEFCSNPAILSRDRTWDTWPGPACSTTRRRHSGRI